MPEHASCHSQVSQVGGRVAEPVRYLFQGHEPGVQRQHGHASCHGVQVDLCPVHIRAVTALLPEVALTHRLVKEGQCLHHGARLLTRRRHVVFKV